MEGPPAPLGLRRVRERLPAREHIPTPSWRVVLAAVVVGLAVTGVWVRLADPVALRGEPPTVDAGDPPAEVAGDAVERLRYVDYTYRLETVQGRTQVTKVDTTDRELFATFGGVRKRYVREGETWAKLQGGGWRALDTGGFNASTATPFDPEAIRNADVTVVRERGKVLVVAIDASAAVAAVLDRPGARGRLEFYVNTRAGRLDRVRYRRDVAGQSGWWEYTFYDYRTTEVRRPSGVPQRSPRDLLADVLGD